MLPHIICIAVVGIFNVLTEVETGFAPGPADAPAPRRMHQPFSADMQHLQQRQGPFGFAGDGGFQVPEPDPGPPPDAPAPGAGPSFWPHQSRQPPPQHAEGARQHSAHPPVPSRDGVPDGGATRPAKTRHPSGFYPSKFEYPKRPSKYSPMFNHHTNDQVSDLSGRSGFPQEHSPPHHPSRVHFPATASPIDQPPTRGRGPWQQQQQPAPPLPSGGSRPAPPRRPPPRPASPRTPLARPAHFATNSRGVQCPAQATGQFPYAGDCRRFLNCWRGRGFVQACAPGTLFNADTRECDHPHKATCEAADAAAPLSDYPPEADLPPEEELPEVGPVGWVEERGPVPTAGTSPPPPPPPPPPPTAARPSAAAAPRCPDRSFSGLAPHPTDCRKFLNCWAGRVFVQECGPGTVFNPRILVCDFPYRVKCAQEGGPQDSQSGRTDRGLSGGPPPSPVSITTESPTRATAFVKTYVTIRRTTTPPPTSPSPTGEEPLATGKPTTPPPTPPTTPLSTPPPRPPTTPPTLPPTTAPTAAREAVAMSWTSPPPSTAPTPPPTPPPPPAALTGQTLRLRGGPSPWEGLVELADANGGWGLLCDGAGQWNLSEAAVVCRQLGFHRGAEAAWQGGAAADAAVAADAVHCSGQEAALARCWLSPARGACAPPSHAAAVRCVRNHASLCRPGELNHEGRCFAVLPPAALSAAEANIRCAAIGARLAELSSQAESDAVSEWLVATHPLVQRALTAGGRRSPGDAWHWAPSGEPLAFHKWWPGWLGEAEAGAEEEELPPGAGGAQCVVAARRFACPAGARAAGDRQGLCDAAYFFWRAEPCERVRAAPLCQRPHSDVGCVSGFGHAYGGAANVTASGEACLPWDAAAAAGALKFRVSERARRANLSGHNHCRRLRGRVEQPWCFAGPEARVEPCDIPRCPPDRGVEKAVAGRGCGAAEFECRPGTCIPHTWLCDGNNDCADGRDERGCVGLLAEFARREGRRLAGEGAAARERWLHTEVATCALRCLEAKHFVCRSFSHMERERTCLLWDTSAALSGGLRADAAWDYWERRALAAECGAAAFRCPDGRCLDARRVCDGRDDCGDRADERLCPGLDFQLRLAAGGAPHQGRLEVRAFGRWGAVCDDLFGAEDADVACRQLGFPLGAADVLPGSHFGTSNLSFSMDDLKCRGNESSLSDCAFAGWGVSDCTVEEEAGLACRLAEAECAPKEWRCAGAAAECIPVGFLCDDVPDCKDGSDEGARCQEATAWRLAGGPHARAGRLEVRRHGVWGTVCDDDFGAAAAAVACRALGLAAAGARARKGGAFGPGRGPVWLDQVLCRGNESSLEQCLHEPWGKHNCAHDEDVSVECEERAPAPAATPAPAPAPSSAPLPGPRLSSGAAPGAEGAAEGAAEGVPEGAAEGAARVLPARCGERWPAAPSVDFRQPRVVASLEVPKGSFPWQASVRARAGPKSVHWCGAVVLGPLHVLTAAHCLLDYVKSAYIVRVGDHDTEADDGTEQEAEVDELYLHEGFNRGARLNNDLALVKLKGRGVHLGAAVQPACLPAPRARFAAGLNCSVSGWGSARAESDGRARRLRAAWVPLLPQDTCRAQAVYGPAALTDSMFCAGRLEGGADACQGDSGGPLVCEDAQGRFTLVGVTSWGLGCGRPNKPGVYTKVSHFREWLDRKLEDSMSGR